MPANGVFHVYNKGVEDRVIFNDDRDYEVFLDYLKGYLTAPPSRESTKQVFVVNGREFKGTPHQPKNYLGKIELVAYSLHSNHFHLLLNQVEDGALPGFIRSLCTRYSIYFNKKYHHSGALFTGPYKSKHIEDGESPILIRYFHKESRYSSREEYLGKRETSWIKSRSDADKKQEFSEEEKKLLSGINFENFDKHETSRNKPEIAKPVSASRKSPQRIPEFFAAAGVFILLITFGINNINASSVKESPPPEVLGIIANTPIPIASPSATPIASPSATPAITKTLTVSISDGSQTVNIRKEPSASSDLVGEAKDGQVFEYVTLDSGWYKVYLTDGAGYISSKYVNLSQTNN